jgi:Flp pilus assembly protein TadD/DNA-binding transcriptional ArsR family regulator
MRDLERLLDQATPLYKARVEELAPQTRVVFDALALAWDPATAADLASVTGLDVGTISVQLDRLVKEGVVEKTSLSSTRRTAFQVAERFFNIWYLMRHSSRRQRLRLRWLTEMLRRIYTPRELRERATGLLAGVEGQGLSSSAFRLALSDALEDRDLRAALRSSVRQHSLFAFEGEVQLEDDFYLSDRAPEPVPAAEAAATYRKAIERNPGDPGLWTGLGRLLLDVPECHAEAEAAYRKAIEIDPELAEPWNNLGYLLAGPLGRHAEAETAYRKAIEIDPNLASPWNNLGNLLARSLGYYAAEAAYLKAIEIDPKLAEPWNNLGYLLTGPLGRHAEAETAYRKAIEIDPKLASPWNNLGNLLARSLGRHAEAEAAYLKAIEIDPKDAETWSDLGNLLADHLFRFEEAEKAYGKALEIDSKNTFALGNLAYLLLRRDGRGADSEMAYRVAVEAVPPPGVRLIRAFHALAADNYGIATAELGSVLKEGHPELFTVFRADLLRNMQFAAERHGDKFLVWLKNSGFSDRYWPLYVAFDAYLHGEGRLMDVNPEVRGGARHLLAEMTRWPSGPPPLEPAKKPRRKSRGA